MVYKLLDGVYQQVGMNFKRSDSSEKNKFQRTPTVGIICPSCDIEVRFDEIIEKKGSVRCVNCFK
jgi:hypothetical protein